METRRGSPFSRSNFRLPSNRFDNLNVPTESSLSVHSAHTFAERETPEKKLEGSIDA